MQHETKLADFKQDHLRLGEMLWEIESTNNTEVRQRYFKSIKAAMLNNLNKEERILKSDDDDDQNLDFIMNFVDHDHHELKEFLQRLNLIDPESSEWMKVFLEFKHYFFLHAKRDDGLLNPDAFN